MFSRRCFIGMSAAAALSPAIIGLPARAQAWPARNMRIVVPLSAGGPTDVAARIVGSRLSEIWGVQAVIENTPGAGGNIGTAAVARSDPDGYTMLINGPSFAISRHLARHPGFDPVTDFAPVTTVCTFPNILAVPNSSPVRSLKEFIDFAKANKSPPTFASAGIGTSTHLTGEMFKRATRLEMTHVPYRGITPAINDLIAGRVDLVVTPPIDQIKTGLVRGLAVTSSKRFPMLPDLPTVTEAGVPGFEVSSWLALFVPANTPSEVVKKMNADATVALADPEVQRRYAQLYLLAGSSTPDELAAFLKSEIEKWGTVIKDAGIKIGG